MFEDVDEGHLDGETPIHYYYNHDERISKAPKIVQDYYSGKLEPVRGFRVLFKNKSNLSILIALIFFVGFAWMYTGFNNSRNYAKINNLAFELQAFSYEEDIYASIKVAEKESKKNKRLRIPSLMKNSSEDNKIASDIDSKSDSLEENDGGQSSSELVTFDIFFIDRDKQLIHQETQNMVLGSEKGAEDYFRTKTADYDIMRVDVIITYAGKEKEISAIIKR